MKHYYKILLLTALVLQCFTGLAQEFDYTIKGEIKGLKNDTLIFSYYDSANGKNKVLKTAGADDKFSITGKATHPSIVFAEINKRRKEGNFTFFIDKGTIRINGDTKEMESISATGTLINDDYSRGNKITDAFYKQRNLLYQQSLAITNKQSDAYKEVIFKSDRNADSLFQFRVNQIKKHPASMFSAMQLYLLTDKLPVNLLDSLYNSLQAPAKNLIQLQRLPAIIKAKKAAQIGSDAPLFSLIDSKGNAIKLSDFKGKYVLLDFWASWCVPCREENPALRAAYQKFKGKSFEIISVSSDENEQKWRKAIVDDALDQWIHVCDFKGIQNEIALKYGVQPIPDNFLIDPDGKIIARGLRGDEVEKKLAQLLNK